MNTESEQTEKAATKRPLISLPFIIIVGVLGVAGYAAGPWLMTQFMLLEEKQKANKIEIPDEFAPISELAKSLQADPNASWEGMSISPGGAGQQLDPAERFAEMDADGDGKLTGDEISERLAGMLDEVDGDSDGAVTKEEFLALFERRSDDGNDAEESPAQDSSSEEASGNSQDDN
jgi:hypothetical protein